MEMNEDRWAATGRYLEEVFAGDPGARLAGLMDRAIAAGLPDIAVSGAVGRLLEVLASTTNGGRGARVAVELGTLAGYSATWIVRGLAPGGRLITLETEAAHADFAEGWFGEAGIADRVEVRRATALEALPGLVEELGEGSVDFVFMDAIKSEYPAYWPWCARLVSPGGMIVADNALGGGTWWIDGAPGTNESRDGADAMNRMAAGDDRFVACCVPVREGVTIARRVGGESR